MAEEKKKLSYEELESAVNTLLHENGQLRAKLQEYAEFRMFKRLDYLFKAVENKEAFSSDFVVGCVDEIETAMYPKEEEETPAKEEEK